jgi:hypothetical protein
VLQKVAASEEAAAKAMGMAKVTDKDA